MYALLAKMLLERDTYPYLGGNNQTGATLWWKGGNSCWIYYRLDYKSRE